MNGLGLVKRKLNMQKRKIFQFPLILTARIRLTKILWGRSNECGILEDPWATPPEEAYGLTVAIEDTPDTPEIIEIDFEKGVPVSVNGKKYALSELDSSFK